ncbi:MAG: flavin reductase [Planctomycetes bacterium]|nr:flavin reductase [Planctomycetota bacterium]
MSEKPGMDALGQVPSGLFIVTCEGASGNHGVLASWVMQAGFMPPAVSVAIKQDRSIMRDLKPGAVFCVNQLAKDDADSKALMGAFAKGFPIGADAFEGQELADGENGGKYLKNALSYLECKLLRTLEPSTEHNLVVGEIVGGGKLRDGEPWVHIRKNGANY